MDDAPAQPLTGAGAAASAGPVEAHRAPGRRPDRTTHVSPDALAGWCARFAASHAGGAAPVLRWRHDGADLLVTAADGASARLVDRWARHPDADPSPTPSPGAASGEHGWSGEVRDLDEVLAAWAVPARTVRTVGLLLVRRGAHAVGIARGGELLVHHTDTHYVQGRTKAGGWSQQRYARRRANQADHAWASAADDLARVVLPRVGTLDALVVGGDRPGLDAVLADRRLAPLAALRQPRILSVPEPRHAVLQSVARELAQVPVEVTDQPGGQR